MLIPKPVAGRLFVTGATLGTVIDGLHNQVLLQYDVAPINIQWTDQWSLATSWIVPPLLGFAYVILGGVLPRLVQSVIASEDGSPKVEQPNTTKRMLLLRAILAVASTAAIVRFSAILVDNSDNTLLGGFFNTAFFASATVPEQHLVLLLSLAMTQWAWLDSSIASLVVASAAAIGGPLAETPFIAAGCWEYLESDALYTVPVSWATDTAGVALHSLTGPCYFAVTMDAIALGRWFAVWDVEEEESDTVDWELGAIADSGPMNNAGKGTPVAVAAAVSSTLGDDDDQTKDNDDTGNQPSHSPSKR